MFVSRKFSRFPKAKHMQSLISELSWSRWCVFGGERASSNTSSTKAFFFHVAKANTQGGFSSYLTLPRAEKN